MTGYHPAVIAIAGYQRFLSPYKGFCCAYRSLTGRDSCSEFVKLSILELGFWRAISQTLRRFRDCKRAAVYLSERDANDERKRVSKTEKACVLGEAVACVPVSCGEVSIGSIASGAGSLVAGGCDGCACTPF